MTKNSFVIYFGGYCFYFCLFWVFTRPVVIIYVGAIMVYVVSRSIIWIIPILFVRKASITIIWTITSSVIRLWAISMIYRIIALFRNWSGVTVSVLALSGYAWFVSKIWQFCQTNNHPEKLLLNGGCDQLVLKLHGSTFPETLLLWTFLFGNFGCFYTYW